MRGGPFIIKNLKTDETQGRGVPNENKIPFKVSTYKEFQYKKTRQSKVVVKDFIDWFVTSTFTFKNMMLFLNSQ